jgi:phage tail protein X
VGSNASSATYARNGGASMEVPRAQGLAYGQGTMPHGQAVRYPDSALRTNGGGQYYGRGEDLV